MSAVPAFVLVHHHAFKCAGTTFAGILEHNFPGRVRYVEANAPDRRLAWQTLASEIDSASANAISSHLATVPPRGHALARLHVSFVREPRARLASAFRFQQQGNAREARGRTFIDFLDEGRHGLLSNYQTRHLSPQDADSWTRRNGWEARPELISFARPDLFVGVVERMDESLLVIERRLGGLGIAFDAAYPQAENVSVADRRLQAAMCAHVHDDMVELDDALYARANAALSRAVHRLGIDATDRETFRARCAATRARARVPSPEHWTYLPSHPPTRQGGLP
jgi:Sulfotransferase family